MLDPYGTVRYGTVLYGITLCSSYAGLMQASLARGAREVRSNSGTTPVSADILEGGAQGNKEITNTTSKRGIANLYTANDKATGRCSGARKARRNTGTPNVPSNL